MTGPVNSIIGVEPAQVIRRFLTSMPAKFDVAHGESILSGVVIEINNDTGKATAIHRLQITYP